MRSGYAKSRVVAIVGYRVTDRRTHKTAVTFAAHAHGRGHRYRYMYLHMSTTSLHSPVIYIHWLRG